jgi:DNA-binding IscR family transcriptional regulator
LDQISVALHVLPFLKQIFMQLHEAGIVDGLHGNHGGYFLAGIAE